MPAKSVSPKAASVRDGRVAAGLSIEEAASKTAKLAFLANRTAEPREPSSIARLREAVRPQPHDPPIEGISAGTWRNVERGKNIRRSTLTLVAAVLEVSVDSLIAGEPNPESWWQRYQFDPTAIIVGDRRIDSKYGTDVLALPPSIGDLFFLNELPFGNLPRIWSDQIVSAMSERALRRQLHGDLLVVGSPTVNLAARVLNRANPFPFAIDTITARTLRELAAKPEAELLEHAEAIRSILRSLGCQVFDPVRWPQGSAFGFRAEKKDFGVLSVCPNPWDKDGIAVLAAGGGGDGTASAMRELCASRALFDRPLGYSFAVRIMNPNDWEIRYRTNKVEEMTPPYSFDRYRKMRARSSRVKAATANALIALLTRRSKSSARSRDH